MRLSCPDGNFDFQIKTMVFASKKSDKSEICKKMSKSVIFGDVTVWLVLSGWPGAGCGGRGGGEGGED